MSLNNEPSAALQRTFGGFVSAAELAALSRLENKRCRDVQKLNY